LAHYAKGTQSLAGPGNPRPNSSSYRLSAYDFRVSFTRLTGVLFTFPSRYWSTIGHAGVFSLGRWASRLPTGLLGPRGTWAPEAGHGPHLGYGTLTRSGAPFQALRLCSHAGPGASAAAPTPAPQPQSTNASRLPGDWFRLLPVRSPLLRESLLLSLPTGTEMFQFPAFAAPPYGLRRRC
jgi:hypothetical protein